MCKSFSWNVGVIDYSGAGGNDVIYYEPPKRYGSNSRINEAGERHGSSGELVERTKAMLFSRVSVDESNTAEKETADEGLWRKNESSQKSEPDNKVRSRSQLRDFPNHRQLSNLCRKFEIISRDSAVILQQRNHGPWSTCSGSSNVRSLVTLFETNLLAADQQQFSMWCECELKLG